MMDTFDRKVFLQADLWERKAYSQYAMAYNTAYQSFQTTVGAAAAAEQASADFFAAVVSIMSCSVGIAALGETWLSRLVVRTGLRTLGVANTRLVANMVREGQQHAVVGFVFGKAMDGIKDAASTRFKNIVADLVEDVAGGLVQTDPLNRYLELNNILIAQKDHLIKMAQAIESDRGLSVTQKAKSTAALHQSPFLSPPRNMLNAK